MLDHPPHSDEHDLVTQESSRRAGHHHDPGHGHVTAQGAVFGIAIALNAAFVVVEFVFGFASNSSALMADAGHNLSDVLGLLLSWGAIVLARRAPSGSFTYGLRGASIFAALINATLLLVTCGVIGWEAILRLSRPEPVAGLLVSGVAAVGIVVNGLSAWLLRKGSRRDLNVRGAYLHMASDAAISLGVVAAGLVILWKGWLWLDPALSLAIVGVIVFSTWAMFRETVRLALDAAPAHVDCDLVEAFLGEREGVEGVHDLHVWAISTTETALTARLVMPGGPPDDAIVDDIERALHERFDIAHSTLQVVRNFPDRVCALQRAGPSHSHEH
jgi:cobalt-zinc-cadmium efflux system protein